MKYLRATIRLLAISGVMAGYYLLWLMGVPFVFAFPKKARQWRNWIFSGWARASAKVMRMKVVVNHTAPPAPFLLVSNHLSYVDVILLRSRLNCVFVAKREIAEWPIVGQVCRSMHTIFIDRDRKRDAVRVRPQLEQAITAEYGVVIFPEGTSTDGRTVLPFRSALLEAAAKQQLPVHYATISYQTPDGECSAEQAICWWGKMTFAGHVFRLLQLREFEGTVTFGGAPVVAGDRRELAAKLWTAVSAQLGPATEREPQMVAEPAGTEAFS
jgi:1-acyl-sn-glycerol-3-phosphate acyltransferase